MSRPIECRFFPRKSDPNAVWRLVRERERKKERERKLQFRIKFEIFSGVCIYAEVVKPGSLEVNTVSIDSNMLTLV